MRSCFLSYKWFVRTELKNNRRACRSQAQKGFQFALSDKNSCNIVTLSFLSFSNLIIQPQRRQLTGRFDYTNETSPTKHTEQKQTLLAMVTVIGQHITQQQSKCLDKATRESSWAVLTQTVPVTEQSKETRERSQISHRKKHNEYYHKSEEYHTYTISLRFLVCIVSCQ